jgi:hypothetical protein
MQLIDAPLPHQADPLDKSRFLSGQTPSPFPPFRLPNDYFPAKISDIFS